MLTAMCNEDGRRRERALQPSRVRVPFRTLLLATTSATQQRNDQTVGIPKGRSGPPRYYDPQSRVRRHGCTTVRRAILASIPQSHRAALPAPDKTVHGDIVPHAELERRCGMTSTGTRKYVRLPRYDSHMMMIAADFELYRDLPLLRMCMCSALYHTHTYYRGKLSVTKVDKYFSII
jgi:hypothetical protein